MRAHELLFEMSNLSPRQTGLGFHVFVSPKGGAKHDIRVKVTPGGWETKPEGNYGLRPDVHHVKGVDWLSAEQKRDLTVWVTLNWDVLLELWEGRIPDDEVLRGKLRGVGAAPPGNYREAIIAMRASAPKVRSIHWGGDAYHLLFDRFVPDAKKVGQRFAKLGFMEPLILVAQGETIPSGIMLWQAT